MKKNSVIVNSFILVIGFLLAFIVGYFLFGKDDTTQEREQTETTSTEEKTEDVEEETDPTEDKDAEELADAIPEEAEALSRNGCLSCHSVEAYNVKAGDVGPDLTISYADIEGKHGKDLDAFLQEPTSAVMATVLADNPLEDEERKQIVEALKKASEGDVSKETAEDQSEDQKENSDED